jgi:hypothetical protein
MIGGKDNAADHDPSEGALSDFENDSAYRNRAATVINRRGWVGLGPP